MKTWLSCTRAAVCLMLVTPLAGWCQNVVSDWNLISEKTIVVHGRKSGFVAPAYYAYVSLAVYDAVASINHRYQPFAVQINASDHASMDAAVVAAAHDVLVHYFPAQQSALDAAQSASLAAIPNSEAKNDGIVIGQSSAAQWIALRANDGLEAPIQFVWGHGPGIWEPTPPFLPPVGFWLTQFKPFTFDSPSRFLFSIEPPTPLNSEDWAEDYNQTRRYGALTGSLRTPQQTEIGLFWTGHPSVTYGSGVRSLIISQKLNTAQAARLSAMAYVSAQDALQACVVAKYHYAFWRPYTAIHAGDTDGNPDTVPDTGWLPLAVTPQHPEYPAAHGCASASLATVFRTFFHRNRIHFQMFSNATGTTHDFDRFSDLVNEVDHARIYGGMHYRHSVLQGNLMGRTVAHHVLEDHFRLIEREEDGEDVGVRR